MAVPPQRLIEVTTTVTIASEKFAFTLPVRALQTIPNLEIFLGRYISKRVRGELVDAAPDELTKRTVLTYEETSTSPRTFSSMDSIDVMSPRP